MAGYCCPPLPTLSSSARCCVRYDYSHHKTAESHSRLRSPCQCNGSLSSVKTKGRADLKVAAVDDNHLEAKITNLTFDMAQTMTDVATVTADVEALHEEIALLKTDLSKLTGSVTMLRASSDRLDNHLTHSLELYEKHNKSRMHWNILLILFLVFDVFVEVCLLAQILE